MMYEAKKLILPGFIGVLVACLIFTAVVVMPLSRPETEFTFPRVEPPPGAPPFGSLKVNLFVSNFTEPLGVSSEAILTVIVTSTHDMNDTTVKFHVYLPYDPDDFPEWGMPLGISITEGKFSMWNGNLRANISVTFTARIKAVEVGEAVIAAKAEWVYHGWLGYEDEDRLWILVLENDIQISHEPITPPGLNECIPGPPH